MYEEEKTKATIEHIELIDSIQNNLYNESKLNHQSIATLNKQSIRKLYSKRLNKIEKDLKQFVSISCNDIDMITNNKSSIWKEYNRIQQATHVTGKTLLAMKTINVQHSIEYMKKIADTAFNLGKRKIKQHLEKRLNYIASKMEPELLRNNQLRCDTIRRDIKMQANTVENLITRNDVNVKCPGDLMYNTCHKIPYSFGNNKKHSLYKYKSLQIENNNGLKNNYKLTCKVLFIRNANFI